MSENNAGSQAAQTTGTTGAQTTQTNGSAQSPVTLEQVQAAIQAALNPFAAALRRTEKQTTTTTQQTTDAGTGERISPAVAEAIKKAEERGNRRTINFALKEAAIEAGIPTTRLDTFKTLFEAKYGSKLEIGDDDAVSVIDGEIPKPLGAFVKDYLKLPEGELFRSPKQLPTSNALSGTNQGTSGDRPFYHELSQEQRFKMTEAERNEYVAADRKRQN